MLIPNAIPIMCEKESALSHTHVVGTQIGVPMISEEIIIKRLLQLIPNNIGKCRYFSLSC